MTDLRVIGVQSELAWEDAAANRSHFEGLLTPLVGQSDVIVLPEMFTTGFTMNTSTCAETMAGPTVLWMKQQASRLDAVLTGSLIIQEGEFFYNRMIWMRPDGEMEYYDKRHLFRMAGEHHHFSAGEKMHITTWRGWRIALQVCYDLRFPVFSRNDRKNPYDLLLYVANWPEVRSSHWRLLLQARAVENQTYVIGVNRVGKDGVDKNYSGDSAIITPKGEYLWQARAGKPEIGQVSLAREPLEKYRAKFPLALDADDFQLK